MLYCILITHKNCFLAPFLIKILEAVWKKSRAALNVYRTKPIAMFWPISPLVKSVANRWLRVTHLRFSARNEDVSRNRWTTVVENGCCSLNSGHQSSFRLVTKTQGLVSCDTSIECNSIEVYASRRSVTNSLKYFLENTQRKKPALPFTYYCTKIGEALSNTISD